MNKEKLVDWALLLLRLASAWIFIESGGLKLFGWFGGMPPGYELSTLLLVAGILEVFGGAAIALGLFTRPVAFVLSGEMAVAYWMGHVSTGGHFFVPIINGGNPAVLLCFIFLFLAAYGAGKWSLDRMIANKRNASRV